MIGFLTKMELKIGQERGIHGKLLLEDDEFRREQGTGIKRWGRKLNLAGIGTLSRLVCNSVRVCGNRIRGGVVSEPPT